MNSRGKVFGAGKQSPAQREYRQERMLTRGKSITLFCMNGHARSEYVGNASDAVIRQSKDDARTRPCSKCQPEAPRPSTATADRKALWD